MEDFRNDAFHLLCGDQSLKGWNFSYELHRITMIHHHKVLRPIHGILCCFFDKNKLQNTERSLSTFFICI